MMLLPLAGRKIRAAAGTAAGPEQDCHRVHPGAGRVRLRTAAAVVGIGCAGHIGIARTGPVEVEGCRSHRDEAERRSCAEVAADIRPEGAANVLGEHDTRLAEEGKASVPENG